MTVPGKGLLVLEHTVAERVSSRRRAWILLGNWTANFYLLKTCKHFIICSNQANILLFEIGWTMLGCWQYQVTSDNFSYSFHHLKDIMHIIR